MPGEAVAIVGMGCRFPKASSPDAFWDLLERGADAITEIPPERWDADALYSPVPRTPGKMSTRWGGFLEDVDGFDPTFFKIMPREAGRIDPQHRLVLEVAWEALESAGVDPAGLAYSQTGVFIGVSHSDHDRLLYSDHARIDGYNGPNTYHCFAANRLSYFLNVRGPSMAIDTACSSSLVAVHLACQSLISGESDLALAGGVNLNLTPEEFVALSFLGVLSSDNRSRTFDAAADGYVRGEGCGMLVLKRLADAIRSGDSVLAVIRGSAVNHNGLSNGITAPNGAAQEEVLRRALRVAGVDPRDVSYVEVMGTATALGDQIEVATLKTVYLAARSASQACWLGSVKPNIGHLEAASGAASLIKVVLSLQHRQIPPHVHCAQVNPNMGLADTPFFIPVVNQPWLSGTDRRLAAVSAFGFGGTNAHMILEEAPDAVVETRARSLHLLTLVCKDRTGAARSGLAVRGPHAEEPAPGPRGRLLHGQYRAIAFRLPAGRARRRHGRTARQAGVVPGDGRSAWPGDGESRQVLFERTGSRRGRHAGADGEVVCSGIRDRLVRILSRRPGASHSVAYLSVPTATLPVGIAGAPPTDSSAPARYCARHACRWILPLDVFGMVAGLIKTAR